MVTICPNQLKVKPVIALENGQWLTSICNTFCLQVQSMLRI